MSDYTPTTEEIAEWYAHKGGSTMAPYYASKLTKRVNEFDRWLAAHDAEVRAAALAEQGETIQKLRGQIEEARNAWWSATEQGDNGLIYTDRIEDAMDEIWSAIGHAEWMPVEQGKATKTEEEP